LKVFGGGPYVNSTSLSVNLNGSFPLTGGKGWEAIINNASASDTSFSVYAVCAQKPTGYRIVSRVHSVPVGSQGPFAARCGGTSVPVGGGGFLSSSSTSANLNSSFASVASWKLIASNDTSTELKVTVDAICPDLLTDMKLVRGSYQLSPPGQQSGASATCPSGKVPLSGGVQWFGSRDVRVNIGDIFPTQQAGFGAYENNASGSSANIRVSAVCSAGF